MIIKKITLNNIRSYRNQEIEFSRGSTLLSGDIGSGKTSVLLGIEFALFGLQPGQKGASLLRNGEGEGGVKIEFSVDNKEIVIERKLKRGKTVSQDYCAISVNGEKREISVTELKNFVLNLLSYPVEFSKKQNMLYKFTVYTPQEEMKQIILEDPKTRVNTLRHIFGIDKYKKILENASIISSKIREEKRVKEAKVENLEQDKLVVLEKEEDLESKRGNLASLEKELFLKTEERKKVQEEKEEIEEKIEEKNRLQQEIEKTNIMISNKKELLVENKKSISALNKQIDELKALIFDEGEIVKTELEIDKLKKEKEILSEKNIEISSKISSMEYKIKDNNSLKEKLTHIEVCPTCMQDVSATYKMNVVNKANEQIKESMSKIEDLKNRKEEIISEVKEINQRIVEKERRASELKILKIKLESIDEKTKRIEEIKRSNDLLERDIDMLSKHVAFLKENIFSMKKYESLYESKEDELKLKLKEERMADIRVAELRKEIDVFSKHIEELNDKIKIGEKVLKELEHLMSLEDWISKSFVPLIMSVEKNVMVKLRSEFSKLFNRWFSMLVSESFNVRLNEEFTPIIEQQDYELDYEHLSGGERTAVALAYRLALNQEINSFLSKIKTKDLVILDEPTDGFSEQQLDKMRDVLNQLNAGQLIMVSHEQKMESFVENVIKFKKEYGVTRVERE